MIVQIDAGLEAAYLTPREAEVLRLVARGCTYMQVADRLGVSLHTVGSHIRNAYRKLGVRSGAAAVMRAVELRLFGEV
jgi:DNA-binding CsgD family transcriptional regulator